MKYYLLLLSISVGFLKLFGQNNELVFEQTQIPYNPEKYVCFKTDQKIEIDGEMNESAWQNASWTNYFVDIEGDLKPLPLQNTRVKMLWDDSCFYFAAYLEEEHLWARLRQRDTVIYKDNDFEIFIDPDGDTHGYYEYEVNAFGTEWDLFLTKPYRDGACALDAFDFPGLKTGVSVKGTLNDPSDADSYWMVEVAIPWLVFKDCAHTNLPPKNGDQWRVNFSRVQWQLDEKKNGYSKKIDPRSGKPYPEYNWVWSPQGLIAMHAPETWGIVQFTSAYKPSENVVFQTKNDEEARWALRRLYYNQRSYRLNKKTFTTDLEILGLNTLELDNYQWPPKLYVTPNMFEAVLKSKDNSQEWHITHDGRIWDEKVK